jgi:hypothetical protein
MKMEASIVSAKNNNLERLKIHTFRKLSGAFAKISTFTLKIGVNDVRVAWVQSTSTTKP